EVIVTDDDVVMARDGGERVAHLAEPAGPRRGGEIDVPHAGDALVEFTTDQDLVFRKAERANALDLATQFLGASAVGDDAEGVAGCAALDRARGRLQGCADARGLCRDGGAGGVLEFTRGKREQREQEGALA